MPYHDWHYNTSDKQMHLKTFKRLGGAILLAVFIISRQSTTTNITKQIFPKNQSVCCSIDVLEQNMSHLHKPES